MLHTVLPQLTSSVCKLDGSSDFNSRLCQYLPTIQEQVVLAMGSIMLGNCCLAVLALAATCAGSWHFWELAYVEKKASKHKRRRKHRRNAIPWDKIK